MAKWSSVDIRQLKKLQKRMEQMQKKDLDEFCRAAIKGLAARILAKVIQKTPTGDYSKLVDFMTKEGIRVSFVPHAGKVGEILKRGWTAGKKVSANVYAQSLKISNAGHIYTIEIENAVYYASYVEFGHRTANHKGWVPGKFILTVSEQELQVQAPAILEKKLLKYFEGVFDV